jgi:hypothetical protein
MFMGCLSLIPPKAGNITATHSSEMAAISRLVEVLAWAFPALSWNFG